MADDHPSGEVRPVIVRDVLDATETQGASVGMRFCAASATGFVPPEPCQSLRNSGSSASGAGKWGIPDEIWILCVEPAGIEFSGEV
jgi:hypothetical protein